jgi:hypothetical protein
MAASMDDTYGQCALAGRCADSGRSSTFGSPRTQSHADFLSLYLASGIGGLAKDTARANELCAKAVRSLQDLATNPDSTPGLAEAQTCLGTT